MFCDKCKFYTLETVPVDMFNLDAGLTKERMCTAGNGDTCIATIAMQREQERGEVVNPCPTCGRDIDGYADCPRCLEIEIGIADYSASARDWERDVLEASQ